MLIWAHHTSASIIGGNTMEIGCLKVPPHLQWTNGNWRPRFCTRSKVMNPEIADLDF